MSLRLNKLHERYSAWRPAGRGVSWRASWRMAGLALVLAAFVLRGAAPTFAMPVDAGPEGMIPVCTGHGMVYVPAGGSNGGGLPGGSAAHVECECCLTAAPGVPVPTPLAIAPGWQFSDFPAPAAARLPAFLAPHRADPIRGPPAHFVSI